MYSRNIESVYVLFYHNNSDKILSVISAITNLQKNLDFQLHKMIPLIITTDKIITNTIFK